MVRARLLAGCKRRGFDGYQCQALPIPTHNSGFSGLPLLAYSHPLCVAHPCVRCRFADALDAYGISVDEVRHHTGIHRQFVT